MDLEKKIECPLCSDPGFKESAVSGKRSYHICSNCHLIFMDSKCRLTPEKEKSRYLMHRNNAENKGYLDFLNQLISPTLPFLKLGMHGLDYGSGPQPILSKLLKDRGFQCDNYDIFFADNILSPPYDFIFSTECFEHFHNPGHEIRKICGLLRPGAILAVMTEFWTTKENFESWYYSRDLTHVSFYNEETMNFISSKFALEILLIDSKRIIIFKSK
ncbi:MAG TPA: class I SAM-dependent methyltransferase [Victivallales bacterium]|nr:class I SAM-dependent methyltransferase [Victivallales bacterium]